MTVTFTPTTWTKFRSSNLFIISTLCLAFFTDDFIYGLVVPVLPFALPQRSNISQQDVQFWTSAMLTAFGFANLLGSPFLGTIADRWPSRKGFLLLGLVLLAAATTLFGLVPNVYALVASRLLQGLSAAVIYTGGLALLVDTVEQDEIGKWMGFVMSFGNAGLLVSPLLGALIYRSFGFHGIFGSMMVLVVLEIFLRLAMVTKNTNGIQDSVAEASNVRSHQRSPRAEQHCRLLTPLERRQSSFERQRRADPVWKMAPLSNHNNSNSNNNKTQPSVFLKLLSQPRILTAVYGVFVAQTLITSFDGVLSIFLLRTFDWGSTEAGLVFLTITIPTLAAPFAGTLSDRFGPRWVAASGYGFAAVFLSMLPLVNYDSVGNIVLLCVVLTTLGFTFSFMISPLAADMTAAVEDMSSQGTLGIESPSGSYGQAFSLLNCGISAGVMVGPALAGFLYETFGWEVMAWNLTVMSLSAVIPIVIYTGTLQSNKDGGIGVA